MAELDDFFDDLKFMVEDEGVSLNFTLGDKTFSIVNDMSPTLSYEFLITDNSDYSFLNPDFQKQNCEKDTTKSDYQIYFDKVKLFCSKGLNESISDTDNFKTINANAKIKSILKEHLNIDYDNLDSSSRPQFGEIRLYTNRLKEGAPRVFFFVGTMNRIYILFYDSGHSIFNATHKASD